MRPLLASLLLAFLLGACASSPSPVKPPLALTPLSEAVPVEERWQLQVGEGVAELYLRLRPVIRGEQGFAIDHRGYLVAFDTRNGELRWERRLDAEVAGALNLSEGLLLLGTSSGRVLALDPADGKPKWEAQVSSEVLALPVSDRGIVVARTVDGRLFALSTTDGAQRWVYDRNVPVLTLRGTSTPVIKDGIVVVGLDNGKLAALTLEEGTVLWETTVAVPSGRSELDRIVDIDADPVVVGELAYVATYQGRVACVDLASGRLLWVRDMSVHSGIAVDPYRVFVSDAEGRVWALDRYNGAVLWKQESLLRRALTGPTLVSGHLVVGDFNGFVHWLRRDNGQMVARARVGEGDAASRAGEERVEGGGKEALTPYSRERNILVAPVAAGEDLFVYDRRGILSVFRLARK